MKTAWIFPGGSARAVYTAGVIYALSEMNLPKPDIIIGCSGSGPTSLCYLSSQREIIKNVWCESLSDGNFLSFKRFWRIMDINYLVDFLLKKKFTLNVKGIKDSTITAYMPITDSLTGEIKYFSNKMDIDILEVARASVSVPFWTNLFSTRGVSINGRYYSDCPPAARFQLHTKKAISEGATRVIVFDNWHGEDNPSGYFFSKLFIRFMKNRKFRERQMEYFKEINSFEEPKDINFHIFSPIRKLAMSRWNDDGGNAKKVFDRGYNETINNKKLLEIYK